ncbi:MAG TPA: hypothetical protein DC049_05730 [Spirochaetia bacterium]|nr:hypothetical protein [Spirochaetia bacterium]
MIILEQNPGCTSDTILGTGISVCRKTQPYWSRWATNMTKHADRADICDEKHPLFTGITEEDLKWWNKDTYLTHAFLTFRKDSKETARGVVLSRIGNGLLPDELMPVQYNYLDSGYSITAFEYTLGAGTLFITTLLIGTKMKFEPVARKMFLNICS